MRSLVRPLVVALALAPLDAPALAAQPAAQPRRVSLAPFVGRALSSPVYDHATRDALTLPTDGREIVQSSVQRLELRDVTLVGARLEARLGRGWTAFAEGARGRTEYEYYGSFTIDDPMDELVRADVSRWVDRARVEQIALGLGRRIATWRPELELGVGAGWSLQRFRLTKLDLICLPGFVCPGVGPWEKKYELPGVMGSLSLRWALRPWLGVEGRSTLSAGRANVEKFSVGCDRKENTAPCQQWVRGAQLSVGASIRP